MTVRNIRQDKSKARDHRTAFSYRRKIDGDFLLGSPGQRPGTGGYDVYLQAAQTELQEAVRGRKEVAEADCAEVGLAEKSKPTAGEKISGRQKQILQNGGYHEERR